MEKSDVFVQRSEETNDEYILRMCCLKETLGCQWSDIAEIIREHTNLILSADACRKRHKTYMETKPKTDAERKLDILARERVKFADERTDNRAAIRRLSREESIKEIASDVAERVKGSFPLLKPVKAVKSKGKSEAILQISDWHYGIEVNTAWNTFNPDVAKDRVARMIAETISYCEKNDVKTLHIFNLGDLICGRIHLPLRISSRIDTITQVIEISEILAEMIQELSMHFEIEYYDCDDNHSRIEPNKKESLALETLVRVAHWFLKNRFDGRKDVHINENAYGSDIIAADICGHPVCAVHGHKDKPNKAINNLSMLTKKHYDLVLTAHLHHFIGNEQNETLLISNGSLMGADDYATDLRLISKPSQNIILCNKDSVVSDIHRVIL